MLAAKWCWVALLAYVTLISADWLMWWLAGQSGMPPSGEESLFFDVLAPGLVCLVLVVYAVWRVGAFDPRLHKEYGAWLAQTPWSTRRPLPLGPIGPTAWDVLAIGAVVLWLWYFHGVDPRIPVVLTLIAFELPMLMVCGRWLAMGVVAVLPCVLYPHLSLTAGTALLAVALPVMVWGSRRELAKFPFADEMWRRPPIDALRQAASESIGWPWDRVGPVYEKPRAGWSWWAWAPPWCRHWPWLLLLAWYLLAVFGTICLLVALDMPFAYRHGVRVSDAGGWSHAVAFMFPTIVGVIAVNRYHRRRTPPMPLLSRLLTGWWWVPGWDVLYRGPLLSVLIGWSAGWALLAVDAPLPWAVSGLLVVTLLPVLTVGPDLERWRYTGHFGHHRGKPTEEEQPEKKKEAKKIEIKLPS